MGGPGSGKPPTPKRGRAMELRARGLSFVAIGRKLGCSRQHVHQLLHESGAPVPPALVRCRRCDAAICEGRQGMWTARALCLGCLDKIPGVTFGRRLIAFRLSKGLTCAELAREMKVDVKRVRIWEGARDPRLPWTRWRWLLGFFGPAFAPAQRPV